ncbi:hypothetical protein [Paenibacillus gallinarum]|uniref:Uncharacterized protein n=1 Tax=Paenibacillus gallinarum TaxID=2762232 RepID=A0ABR8SWG0_9BACL|nr:hypothetical protein [Paenibacillus gallinarum]MBD7967725.1 hypothetical protein [Paenibacillus gallinarum]
MLNNLSVAELEEIAADELLDYDIRIEATKELMQRGRNNGGPNKTICKK